MAMKNEELKIVFCFPGSSFSGEFLESWTNLMIYCIKHEIKFALQRRGGSVVNFVRTMCIGGAVLRGKDQKPFGGALDYTHLMWIDSDIIFTPQEFQKLLEDDKDIVSGLYLMADNQHFTVVKDWDEEYFAKYGTFNFLQKSDIKNQNQLFPAAYNGMGFMLIKKGVFETLQYPWFEPIHQSIKNLEDFTSEDVAFCLKAREKGFEIFVDPTVIVGHQKSMILK
jgi:GT2 family glycosyltransferase